MRAFTALELVTLPRLDTFGALTLSAQLITAGECEGALPEHVVSALGGVKKKRRTLQTETARPQGPSPADTARARAADTKIDAAYRALDRFLEAWSSLDGPNEAVRASYARAALFPDGLGFLQLPFKQEWAASEVVLARLKDEAVDEAVRSLGGGPMIKHIQRAHAEYGEALAITVMPAEPDGIGVRAAFDDLATAMREYVVVLVATARTGDSSAQERVDRMLRPIADWPVRRAAGGDAGADPSGEAGANGVGPDPSTSAAPAS